MFSLYHPQFLKIIWIYIFLQLINIIIAIFNECIGRGLSCSSKIPSGFSTISKSCHPLPPRLCGRHFFPGQTEAFSKSLTILGKLSCPNKNKKITLLIRWVGNAQWRYAKYHHPNSHGAFFKSFWRQKRRGIEKRQSRALHGSGTIRQSRALHGSGTICNNKRITLHSTAQTDNTCFFCHPTTRRISFFEYCHLILSKNLFLGFMTINLPGRALYDNLLVRTSIHESRLSPLVNLLFHLSKSHNKPDLTLP